MHMYVRIAVDYKQPFSAFKYLQVTSHTWNHKNNKHMHGLMLSLIINVPLNVPLGKALKLSISMGGVCYKVIEVTQHESKYGALNSIH